VSKVIKLSLVVLAAASLPAQSVDVERLDGSHLSIENYSEHRANVFVFLSSQSSETRRDSAAIRQANEKYRRRNLMFIGVFPNPAEAADEVLKFCQASGFTFPCYRDPSHKAAKALGASVTPEVFVLDSAGKVVFKGGVGGMEQALADIAAQQSVRVQSATLEGTPIDKPGGPLSIDDPYGTLTYSSELIFEKIPGAPNHHASSIIEAANGDLLVTWYGGSYESSDDEALFMARRKKGQHIWETPVMLRRDFNAPVGNAIIFTDQRGRVWIVWGRLEAKQPLLAHTGWERTRLLYRISEDNGHTWSEDKLFPMDTTGWLPRNLPIKLSTGELIVPLSDERNDKDLSFFVITKDSGATWMRSSNIPNAQSQGEQPTVAQRKDGSLLAFLRTGPRLLQSESFDRGMTWSLAKLTGFKNPDAAISLCALKNGNLILAWNNQERGRSPLHIARSTDSGKTWSTPLMLESNPGEYSYPSVFQASDGLIHVIYTYRRYSIKHVVFNEDWLYRYERPD
jgi:predicted neuraminidase/peroxiredoxin